MFVSILKKSLFFALSFTCFEAISSINLNPMNAQRSAQLVNLNFQITSKNKMIKSEFMMPLNQTAELEKKFGDKNILMEINPRRGKNPDEIALDMKFYKNSSSKAFFKKEIIAKLNESSSITFRGISLKVKPVLN